MIHSAKTHLTREEYNKLAGILFLSVGAVERRDTNYLSRLSLEAHDITQEMDEYRHARNYGFTFAMVWAGVNNPALLVDRLGLTVDMGKSL